jgi:SAM-dependent methyltransferase
MISGVPTSAGTRAAGWAWQRSWDCQQEGYMPDREHRFAAMLDAVEAVTGEMDRPPAVLDLAGGTGSISLRLLRRLPDAAITLVDLDPVLLYLARATLPATVTVTVADLRDPAWHRQLATRSFDAVLTATALHWLAPDRLSALYREVHEILGPGGILINADRMTDDGLPTLTEAITAHDERRRDTAYATGAHRSWTQWWDHVAADPVLGPLKQQRDALFGTNHSQEWTPSASWHLQALRDAGYTEAGLIWRGGADAAIAARRDPSVQPFDPGDGHRPR